MNAAQEQAFRVLAALVGREADHPNAVPLVRRDGTLTEEAIRLRDEAFVRDLTDPRAESYHVQAIRQEIYGIRV